MTPEECALLACRLSTTYRARVNPGSAKLVGAMEALGRLEAVQARDLMLEAAAEFASAATAIRSIVETISKAPQDGGAKGAT